MRTICDRSRMGLFLAAMAVGGLVLAGTTGCEPLTVPDEQTVPRGVDPQDPYTDPAPEIEREDRGVDVEVNGNGVDVEVDRGADGDVDVEIDLDAEPEVRTPRFDLEDGD